MLLLLVQQSLPLPPLADGVEDRLVDPVEELKDADDAGPGEQAKGSAWEVQLKFRHWSM